MPGSDTCTGGGTTAPANTDEEQSDKNTTEQILNLEIAFISEPSDKAQCLQGRKHNQKEQYLANVVGSTPLRSFKTCTLHAKMLKSLFLNHIDSIPAFDYLNM